MVYKSHVTEDLLPTKPVFFCDIYTKVSVPLHHLLLLDNFYIIASLIQPYNTFKDHCVLKTILVSMPGFFHDTGFSGLENAP